MSALRKDVWSERLDGREPLQLGVSVRTPLGSRPGVLEELSPHGCLLAFATANCLGDAVSIQAPGFAPFQGTVIWNDGARCGLSFQQPLHIAVVGHLVQLGTV